MENKIFKSIDGLFEENLDYLRLKNIKNINFKKISIIGREIQYPLYLLVKAPR